MPLSPVIEKLVEKAIIDGSFEKPLDFEDVCNRLMKRIPEYESLRTSKLDPYSSAPSKSADAYIYLEDKRKWIYFEYTTSSRERIRRYVKELVKRKYYMEKVGQIQELVLVFSQSLRSEQRHELKNHVETQLQCSCHIFDSHDLVSIFEESAVDLVEPLLGIECRPKWFVSLEDAVNELNNRYIAFPKLETFRESNLYKDENLTKIVAAQIYEHRGSCLLTGRWGSGKTIFALTLGFELQIKNNFLVYYLDLNKLIGYNEGVIISEILNKSLLPFHHRQVLFIIDNAHVFSKASYQFAQWGIKEKANVLLVSRPIPKEMCDENQYFPRFFESFIEEIPATESEELLEDQNSVDEDVSLSEYRPPCFMIRPSLAIIRWLVNQRLRMLGEKYEYDDNDLAVLGERVGHNLTLLTLLLNHWNPRFGAISETNIDPIYDTLLKRFQLDKFPEIYMLAALNHFDCPADLDVLFQTLERKSAFVSTFLTDGGEAYGVVLKRRKRAFGINCAEAKLICETGLYFKEISLCDSNKRMPASFTELLKILLVRYASRKPSNPYEMLRSLRWAAFEAKVFKGVQQEESIVEILSTILICPEFMDYIRDVILPNSLSMLGLGNIARLYKYVGMQNEHHSKVLCNEVVKKGIIRYESLWLEKYPSYEHWFTWREFFAWRHLNNLNQKLASFFLQQFDYDKLCSHGKNSLRGLSNLFLMAARTKWLKVKVEDDLEDLFGNPEEFDENFYKLKEANICFFIRHAGLLGDSSVKYLSSYIPPKRMAQVAKGLLKLSSQLFYIVFRFMGINYSRDFAGEFKSDEIYDLVYGQNLGDINFPVSDSLYRRFLENDLTPKVLTSDLHESQLFLRNLSLHGFKARHCAWTSETFKNEKLKKAIITKIIHEKPPLIDIAFFSLNLATLDPQTAADYVDQMTGLDLSEIIAGASLSDLGLFILSIWTAGAFSALEFVKVDLLRGMIKTNIMQSSIPDLLGIGGIISLLNLDFQIQMTFEELADRIGCYFARFQSAITEEGLELRRQNRALRLALNLEGVKYLGGSISHSVISRYIDKDFFSKMLTDAKEQIKRDARTLMSDALGRLPEAAERKVELLKRALAWLEE